MTVFGKSISLFLVDGTPNARWIYELSNWTGKAYRIPRNWIKESVNRKELSSPGIYFLFGKDDEDRRPLIYVGEAENIIQRLKQHLDGKDYWNEVIVFISKDDHLNKAHIKYLENRFHAIAMESKRYKVMNSTVPTKSTVSEPEQAQLEEFIYNAKILVNTLGHKVFEPVAEEFKTDGAKEKEYFISVGDITAKGIMTSDGFVLLKESQIHKNTAYKSISSGIRKLIDQYKADGKVIDSVLTEDVLFTSSSAAAVFVLGYSVSGPKTWKDASGKSLKENEGI